MVSGEATLHAAFADEADVGTALERLAGSGVDPGRIEVRSSVPLDHGLRPLNLDLRSRVPWMAIVGGLLGGAAAFFVATLTAQAYPLPTGGMPIVALPPIGIITFEGVAIGALLSTMATVLYEGGLPKLRHVSGPLDEHLADGRIVVSVSMTDGDAGDWASEAVATAVG